MENYGKTFRCPRQGCGRAFRCRASTPQGKGRATINARWNLDAHEQAHKRRDISGRSHADLHPKQPKDVPRRNRPEPPLWMTA